MTGTHVVENRAVATKGVCRGGVEKGSRGISKKGSGRW